LNPEEFKIYIIEIFKSYGFSNDIANVLKSVFVILIMIIIAVAFYFITKKLLLRIIHKIIKKSKNEYDDIFLDNRVFDSLSYLLPAVVIYEMIPYALSYSFISFVRPLIIIFLIIIILRVINLVLNALHEVYLKLPVSKNSNITGYIQIVKIVISIIGIIFIFSILFDKSPKTLLTGLGAATAIILLIFKDTILGLVAGIQLSANKMLKTGDWISVPSKNADGNVIEISLHTVKVQNFNKTITTIPTYSLVNDSFTNWTGMEKSGGRRIKRSINIDLNTVKFCSTEMLNKFEKIDLLKEYIVETRREITEYNNQKEPENISSPNIRQLTNIGTFRIYIQKFLESKLFDNNQNTKGEFRKEMTLLVRQLQSTEKGLPIQIYVFASTVAWVKYETIQSDLFDHLFAIISEFELKVFQNPTGNDFAEKF
jgi:miniconductance mechanosensitive channel